MTILNTVNESELSSPMKALIEKFSSAKHYANGLKIFSHKQEVFEPIWTAYMQMLETGKLDRELKQLIRAKIAQNNDCSPYSEKTGNPDFPILLEELNESTKKKLKEVSCYEISVVLSRREKLALKFAEKLGVEPESLDDHFFESLREEFSDPEIVELGHVTAVGIGFERFLSVWEPRVCELQKPLDD